MTFRDVIRRGGGKTEEVGHHEHDAPDISGVFNFLRALSAKITGDVDIEGDITLAGDLTGLSQLFLHGTVQHLNIINTGDSDYPNRMLVIDAIESGGGLVVGRLFVADFNPQPTVFSRILDLYQDGTVQWPTATTASAPHIRLFDFNTGIWGETGKVGVAIEGIDVGGFTADGLNPFGGGVPIGAILPYGGTTAPTGYLLCQGQVISRTTYAKLFTAIGTTFGAGDGSTTFGIPNLQGRFPLGKAAAGTGSTLGGTGGAIDHTHTGPSHDHSINPPNTGTSSDNHSHTVDIAGFNSGGSSSNAIAVEDAGTTFSYATGAHVHSVNPPNTATSADAHSHTVDIGAFNSALDGTGATGTANPPFQTVNYIIRTMV